MTAGPIGQPHRRSEDPRLLTGRALFVDDVALPGMAHVAFLRSPHAHARLGRIEVEAARTAPGVLAVITAEDLGAYWQPGPLLVPPPPVVGMIFHQRTQVPLARGKVRHVGEPVALVVAESRYAAEDAVERIQADYDPLPAVVDLEQALEPGAARVHEDLDSNIAATVPQRKGDYAAAKARAHLVVRRRLSYDRGAAAAIENRGVVAQWDERSQRLTVWDTTQAPIPIRNGLAAMLGLSEHQVRVLAPFIGGGFGPKIMMFYPEEVLVPWLAIRLGRPVKWMSDRAEDFVSTTQERLQIHDAELAVDAGGRILGIHDRFLHDTGAYDPYGLTVPLNSQCTLLGPYQVPAYDSEFTAVFTNKPIVTPYRGAGRQHGVFVIERLLDLAARELGMDRNEIRRRNFLRPDQFPHDHQIIYQDFTPLTYDSGNYQPLLDKALAMIGYDAFVRDEQPRLWAEGRAVGIGVVAYVEGTGIGPFEGARVQVQTSGKVSVATGVGTQGQGHFTVLAQIAAEEIELVNGAARVRADPSRAIGLGELARRANPMRGAVKPGTEPGLESTRYFGPARGATASGTHAMILELDRETLQLAIRKYVVVHDCGRVLNPLIVHGQVQGGVAQGIGNAYYEQLVFDDQGQLLNASFMDFLLPTALEVPAVEVGHEETPSPLNALGTKGAGEAGAIPVGALFAQAVEDALQVPGLEILEIPLRPSRLWELVEEARSQVR